MTAFNETPEEPMQIDAMSFSNIPSVEFLSRLLLYPAPAFASALKPEDVKAQYCQQESQ